MKASAKNKEKVTKAENDCCCISTVKKLIGNYVLTLI